jgi:outer membrane protein assembly factor BamB
MKYFRFLLSSLALLVSCTGIYLTPNASVSHALIENPYMDAKWSKNNLRIDVDSNMARLITAPNRVFVLELGIYQRTVKAFDAITGALAWLQNDVHINTMAAHNSVFYTTELGLIRTYAPENGRNIQNFILPYTGPLAFVNFYKDKMFAYTSNGSFFTLDIGSGQVLKSIGPNLYPVPLTIEDDVTYANKNGIIAMDTETGKILWESEIGRGYTGPLFMDDVIYVREGDSVIPGKVYAIEKTNGGILWKYDADVISNLCALGSNLYFLTWDGYLMVVDRITGQEVAKLEFSPRPFLLPTAGINSGGYYIAADPQNNIIFVSLGDSYQLFALQIKNK